MVLNLYTVFDSKVEAYFTPFPAANHASAIRLFTDKVNTPNHEWARHPEDFTLFHIASYDDQTAVISPAKAHTALGKAIEYVREPQRS